MRAMRSLLPFLLSLFSGAAVQAQWWKVQTSGIESNLRGVSVAKTRDAKGAPVPVVWASGSNGVILKSAGEGKTSRIYKTTDGGEIWNLQYTDKRKEFFLDSIACLSETSCFALGDPIDGKFLLLASTDGEHWNPLPSGNMPIALTGEGAFAASNTCLVVSGKEIFFGTGGP